MLWQVLRLCKVRLWPKSPGILRAPCQPDWKRTGRPVAREHNQDAASSSLVWQKDAILDESTRRLAAAEKNQELLIFHGNLKSTRKLFASGNSDIDSIGKILATSSPKNYRLRTAHGEGFLECEIKILVSVRETTWNISMWMRLSGNIYVRHSSSCSSSWERFSGNLRSTRNQHVKSLKQLFQVTGKLIRDLTEITSILVIDWQQQMWEPCLMTMQFSSPLQNPCPFRFSAVSGRHQSRSRQSMEGQGQLVLGITST